MGPIDLLYPSPEPDFRILQVFLIYFPKGPSLSAVKIYAANVELYYFLTYNEVQFVSEKSLLLVEC